jgi:probable F420-dependent oxidoreductase
MRFTIGLPTDHVTRVEEFVTGDAVMACARTAETAGFDACFVTDHPAPDAKWLAGGGHHALDPFVALSFAAAATDRIRLQTHILVLPYRNPLLAAKSVLSLDVLSGGRVILGVAPGYLKPEFAALGVDFDERNELTDEAIDVMCRIWTDGEIETEGRHFRTRGTTMRPLPVQRPHPPIWIGGNSTAAIRRAAERGQGWVPFPNPGGRTSRVRTPELSNIEELRRRVDILREHAATIGRTEPVDICFSTFADDPDESIEELHVLEAIGVTWAVLHTPPVPTRAAWTDAVEHLGAAVIARYRARSATRSSS